MRVTTVYGSKGCFAAGTLVSTPQGRRPIEDIQVGDEVYSYSDVVNGVEVDRVTAVHHHEAEPVVRYTFWGEHEVVATPSHWVLNQHGAFVAIGTLTTDDAVIDHLGHLRPLIRVEELDDEPVFNLSVERNKTYIVNDIRVHNQGTSRHPRVKGKKGNSKGAGGRAAKEDPNTLRSRATVKVIDLISQGETYGLVNKTNPLKSVYFDDTPLMNTDGTLNFGNAIAEERVGTQAQTYIEGFPQANNPIGVGVKVTTTAAVTRTMPADTDAARVVIQVANLYKTNKETGDISGNSVTFRIEYKRTVDAAWATVSTTTIDGKTMSPYEREFRIPRAGTSGTWDIRVSRITPDNTESSIGNDIYWSRYVAIKDVKLAYPGKAYIAVAADAESTGGDIPKRSYDYKGVLCKVPNNYDPETRVYTGTWSGTFASARQWTNNPAWVVYDMLIDPVYGLGEFIDETMLNKFSFYDAAVYCDQNVPFTNANGQTTQGPRFSFNAPINVQEDAWKLIQSMASVANGFIGEAGGLITFIQDRPKNPIKLLTKSNAIDGKFSYQGTSILSRHNMVHVTYNEPNDNYLPRTITEKSQTHIDRYGLNPTELVAFGCTNEAQARRLAKWVIETENSATWVLTYRAAWDHVDVVPGDIVKVMDPHFAGYDYGGRVTAATINNITLDRLIDHSAPGTYTISLMDTDGVTVHERTINSWATVGGVTRVNVPNLPSVLPVGTTWVIQGPIAAAQYRIISIKEETPGEFTITGLLHDPGKYARVENGIVVPPPVYSGVGKQPPKVPTNLSVKEETYTDAQRTKRRLRFNWSTDQGDYITRAAVKWSVDGKAFVAVDNIRQPEFILEDVTPGNYTFILTTYNVVNVASPTATVSYALNTGVNGTPVTSSTLKAPVNVGVVLPNAFGTRPTTFWTEDVTIGWDNAPDNINLAGGVVDVVDYWKVEFLRPDNSLFHTIDNVKKLETTFPLSVNAQKFGNGGVGTGTFKVRVTPYDAAGRAGLASTPVTISALALSPVTSLAATGGIWNTPDLTVTWANQVTLPTGQAAAQNTLGFFKEYVVTVSPAGSPNVTTYTERVTGTTFNWTFAKNKSVSPTNPLPSVIIKVVATDDFGNSSTAVSQTFTAITPPSISSLSQDIVANGSTFYEPDLNVKWACIMSDGNDYTASPLFAGYEVSIYRPTPSSLRRISISKTASFTYSYAMNKADPLGPLPNIQVFVAPRDVFNRTGPDSSATFNAVTPPQPSSVAVNTTAGGSVFTTPDFPVKWTAQLNSANYSTSKLFDHYEVKVKTTLGTQRHLEKVSTENYVYPFSSNQAEFNPASPSVQFEVTSVDVFGQRSASTNQAFTTIAPTAVTSLVTSSGGTTYQTYDLGMVWTCQTAPNAAGQYVNSPLFKAFKVEVKSTGGVLKNTFYPTEQNQSYLFTQNRNDFGGTPSRSVQVVVTAQDVFGQLGTAATTTFTNPAPAAPGITFTAGYNMQFFQLSPPTEPDIEGYIVLVKKSSSGVDVGIGGEPNPPTYKVYDGRDFWGSFQVDPGSTYYVRAAAYDQFGKDQLNYTSEQSFSTLSEVKAILYEYTGFIFANDETTKKVSWTAGTGIRMTEPGGTVSIAASTGTGVQWTSGTLYFYHLWPETFLRSTTNVSTILANPQGTVTILATYDGTKLVNGGGKVFMNGNEVVAGTITATQLIQTQAVITNQAQMGVATIGSAAIGNAAVTTAAIQDLAVDTIKLKNGSITQVTGNNLTDIVYGYLQASPAGQTGTSYKDSGWQTVDTLTFQNPPITAGSSLFGYANVVFGGKMSTGLTSSAGGGKPYPDGSSPVQGGGTHAYRLVLEAQDMYDGLWYVQPDSLYWPAVKARASLTDLFVGDNPSIFSSALSFRTLQNNIPGAAGTTTQSQGIQYRPSQFFRIKFQVRTSIWNRVEKQENFPTLSAISGTLPTPNPANSLPFRYWFTSAGAVSTNGIPVANIPTDTSVSNAYLIVTQVLK